MKLKNPRKRSNFESHGKSPMRVLNRMNISDVAIARECRCTVEEVKLLRKKKLTGRRKQLVSLRVNSMPAHFRQMHQGNKPSKGWLGKLTRKVVK